jgi:hypothetical protein
MAGWCWRGQRGNPLFSWQFFRAGYAFDDELWSVRGDGPVVLASQGFTKNGPEGLRLEPYSGRFLQFAAGVTL